MTSHNTEQLEEMAVSSYILHANYTSDDKYSDDNSSLGSYLDYCQQEGNA